MKCHLFYGYMMKKIISILALLTTASWVQAAPQENVPFVFTAGISEPAFTTQSRWVKELSGDKDATAIGEKQFLDAFIAPYQVLFSQAKKINQQQFVAFEENRLDQIVQSHREASVKQAHVRFGVLNKNKDGKLSLKEFQDVGVRSFESFDKNADGLVNADDIPFETKKEGLHGGAMFKMAVSIPVPTDVKSFIEQHGQGKGYVTLAQLLSEREKQFIEADLNHDWSLSEEEYVNEFTQRYDQNTVQAKVGLNAFYQERFTAIAQGKPEIGLKEIKRFAEKVFTYWDKNNNGKIEIGE